MNVCEFVKTYCKFFYYKEEELDMLNYDFLKETNIISNIDTCVITIDMRFYDDKKLTFQSVSLDYDMFEYLSNRLLQITECENLIYFHDKSFMIMGKSENGKVVYVPTVRKKENALHVKTDSISRIKRFRMIALVILLILVIELIFSMIVLNQYGNKPISEVPLWVWWMLFI